MEADKKEYNGWKFYPVETGGGYWEKRFGRGRVSVDSGESLTITYSYGANSDDSLSSTRWNYDNPPLDEFDVMDRIDRNGGKDGPIGHDRPEED